MRFRLLRRRLTISAPSMAIRSALPWPFRWVAMAVVLGVCAAVGLWVFELGRELAGLDGGAKEELVKLKQLWTLMGVPTVPAAATSGINVVKKK